MREFATFFARVKNRILGYAGRASVVEDASVLAGASSVARLRADQHSRRTPTGQEGYSETDPLDRPDPDQISRVRIGVLARFKQQERCELTCSVFTASIIAAELVAPASMAVLSATGPRTRTASCA
jgi:hypothetical protein